MEKTEPHGDTYSQYTIEQLVVFTLDNTLYALPLNVVIQVIHAIAIKKLPKAPGFISGIINVRGSIIPVVNLRKRFSLPDREISLNDHLVIADSGKRTIALLADEVTGIKDIIPGQFFSTREPLPYAKYIRGVAKIQADIILIYDLEKFLSLDEETELEEALKKRNG